MSQKYILVVDDDPDLVETVAMMLESKGCEVGRAYDGIEGEESIKERRPDLVILDIMMPRKDGYVLCNEMKAKEETRDIPVVLLTAVGEAVPSTRYSHADGMATEADDYIPKPIETEIHFLLCLPRRQRQIFTPLIKKNIPEATVAEIGSAARFTMNGPHFGDRHGIAYKLFTALEQAGVDLLGLGCSIASITGVVASDSIEATTAAIRTCFEVPCVIDRNFHS